MDRRKKPYNQIEPFTSMPIVHGPKRKGVEPILAPDDFWSLVLDNSTLRVGHFSFNGHHFSTFVETHKVLRNPEACHKLAESIVRGYGRFFDCVVHPTHESAILLAQATCSALSTLFAAKTPPALVPASRTDEGDYIISPAYRPLLHKKRVLVIDDGANFGDTLSGLYFATREFEPTSIDCCVFVDRLTAFSRRKLESIIGADKLRSLFYLPFPAYHRQDCPVCRENAELVRHSKSRVGKEAEAHLASKRLKLEFIDEPPYMDMIGAR